MGKSSADHHARSQTVLTWGIFDGVHIGHQALFHEMKRIARQENLNTTVLTFEPHPEEVLLGSKIFSICSLRDRVDMIKRASIDKVKVIPFTRAFASMDPSVFLDLIAKKECHAKSIVLGFDSCFGKNRSGNVAYAQSWGARHDIQVESFGPERDDHGEGQPISSTRIKDCLVKGDMRAAIRLLGHPYTLSGLVIRGASRGKHIGIPTANIICPDILLPASGVYATRTILNEYEYPSVTNIGNRPTFEQNAPTSIETHLLSYSGDDFYNEKICVIFDSYIRPEKQFQNTDELQRQIQQDINERHSLIME